ncbi:MAG: ankyrin repeat domain-containing protein [Planctomycetota bacterium]|jgi:ankyrin repeat protein
MPRPVVAAVFGLLALASAQEPFPLPKPRPAPPLLDDARTAALAKQLCTAIDARAVAAVKKVLADGANPNVGMGAGEGDTADRTPLIHAVLVRDQALVSLLAAAGARLENGDAAGHTPLMYATLQEDADMVHFLLRAGARPDAADGEGNRASAFPKDAPKLAELLHAAEKQHDAVIAAIADDDLGKARAAIADGASPNANDGVRCVLLQAVRSGDQEACRELLVAGCRADLLLVEGFSLTSPLAHAAQFGDLALLQLLLKPGLGQLALDDALACAVDHDGDDRAVRVQSLLDAGARPRSSIGLAPGPLQRAAARGDLATMAKLLAAGADQDAVDQALASAAGSEDADAALATVRALLAIGADASHELFQTTTLGAAGKRGHQAVLELLFPKCSDKVLSLTVAQLAREGAAPALTWLCRKAKGRIDYVDAPTPFDPPLQVAITEGHLDCVQALLAAGCPAEQAPGFSHETPLVAALRAGNREAIALLLAAGVDPGKVWEAPLRRPQSALDVAREIGNDELLALLAATLQKKADPDDPLGTTLRLTGLRSEDIGKFHELRYTNTETNRGQKVYLRKKVERYGALAVQEIWSLAYDKPDAPGAELLQKAFQRRYSLGGLVLEQPSKEQPNWRIRFRLSAAVDMSPKDLAKYCDLAQDAGDSLERELNPGAEDTL